MIDVLTPDNIVCRTDDGKVLEGKFMAPSGQGCYANKGIFNIYAVHKVLCPWFYETMNLNLK